MRLKIGLFGPFRASLDGRPLPLRSRRGQALLAMLALAPTGAVARDRLAATLWPDRAGEQARASLRQEISALRRALGGEIVSADANAVRIDGAAVDPSIGAPDDGDFLEGLDLMSEPFDDWRRDQTSRLAEAADTAPPTDKSAEIFGNPSVLVMGFVAASAGDEDVAFATGLVIDLRNSLALWRSFPVMGPEAIGWRTERDGPLAETAGQVGAVYAISGAVRRAADRVRVSVSLVRVDNGHLVWSDTFDGDLSDVFAIQEAIALGVVARVVPEIEHAETARIARRAPAQWSAWQLVARCEDLERAGGAGYGSPESNAAQVPLLEEAVAIDPDYARAWARLGRFWFRSAMQGWIDDHDVGIDRAMELTERAIALDPLEWEAHSYRALTLIFGRQAFGPARFHAFEGVRLNPSAPVARHGLGCALEWLGETEEALKHLRLVFDLNPNHPNRAAVLGDITTCELLSGKTDAAVETARQLRDAAPDYCRGLQRVAVTLGHAGLAEEAVPVLARIAQLQPGFDEAYVRQTYPYARPEHVEMILAGLRKAGWTGA